MSITGLEDISFSKEEVKENREGSINTTKTLIFKHEASAGDLVIDTTALVTPSEASSRGFVQPNLAEVAELQLLVNKKNLKIHSSRGVWLQMYEDFVVTGQNTIQLVGNIEDLGGALEGEVFTVYATPVQANSILTTDAKKMYQEYTLADGQTVLNLGREYAVNTNSAAQIGSIRVFRNGVGPQLRNVGNAAANPLADGNYEEVDSGNGIGTTIEFNVAPSGQDDVIVVEFGLEYAGDLSIVGDIQSAWGAIMKLADDVKDLGPYPITRYLTANPSEVERRAFGDIVLGMLDIGIPYETPWENTGPVTISAITSTPTKGTVVLDKLWLSRRGGKARIRIEYRQSAAGLAGSGDYLFKMPNGLLIDTTKMTPYTTNETWNSSFNNTNFIGVCQGGSGANQFFGGVVVYDSEYVRFAAEDGSQNTQGFISSNGYHLGPAGATYYLAEFEVPILGWEETQTIRERLGL